MTLKIHFRQSLNARLHTRSRRYNIARMHQGCAAQKTLALKDANDFKDLLFYAD